MIKEEKIVATAFFMGYTLQFDYKKVEETVAQPRTLVTVSDLKYNHDDEILVGGCNYFFFFNHISPQIFY